MNKIICFILCFLYTNVNCMHHIHGKLEIEYGATLEIGSATNVRVSGGIENYGTITMESGSTTSALSLEGDAKIRNLATIDATVLFSPSDFPPFRMPFVHKDIIIAPSDIPNVTLENGIPLAEFASYITACELWLNAYHDDENRLDDEEGIHRVAVLEVHGEPISVSANLSCKLRKNETPIKLRVDRGTVILSGDNSQYIDGKVSIRPEATAVIVTSDALPQSDMKVSGRLQFEADSETSYTTASGKTVDISLGTVKVGSKALLTIPNGGTMVF